LGEKHIEAIIGKLNKACYIIRRTKQYLSNDALKMVYYAFFHSIMSYGLIFWGNTTHSRYIFKLHKRAVRMMVRARNRDSCKRIFGPLKILPLPSQYIYSLVMFVVNNMDLFIINNDRYTTETRNSSNLYFPLSNITIFQKGMQYFGINAYNNLPDKIKHLSNNKNQFKKTLLLFFYLHSFYSIEECFKYKDK
jgi:hypothetical protein